MKKALLVLFSVTLACTTEMPISPYVGPLAIFLEQDILCAGQASRIHAMELDSWREIPISELSFNPIPIGLGSISKSGIYTAPENISQQTLVQISAKLKNGATGQLTGEFKIYPKNSFPGTGVRSIPVQLGNFNRPFAIMDNRDIILGSYVDEFYTDFHKNKIRRVTQEGEVVWERDFSPENPKSLTVANGNIYVALGIDIKLQRTVILNENGNLLKEFPISKEENLRSFIVDGNGLIYFLFKNYELNINDLIVVNENGELIRKYSFPFNVESIEVTSDNNIIGIGTVDENEVSKQFLLLKKGGEDAFQIIWEEEFELNSPKDQLILMHSNYVGLLLDIGFSSIVDNIPSRSWILDVIKTDGTVIFTNRVIHESNPPSADASHLIKNVKHGVLGNVEHILVTQAGEVYFAGSSSNQTIAFIEIVKLSNGAHWRYGLKRDEWTVSNLIPPYSRDRVASISFTEKDGMLTYMISNGSEILSFNLDSNLNFDPCSYNPVW